MSAPDRGNDITPPERSDEQSVEPAAPTGTPVTPPSMTVPFPGGAEAAAAASAAGSVVAGTSIGRYRVERVVGAGGIGLVIAAHDAELGRSVAIKLLAREHADARVRLMREAQAMAKLSHPNVVTVHEVVRVGDRAGIVMELIDGHDLATWRAAAPRTWREIVAVYVQAARGLAAAHRAGLVHRDFKPANALIDRDGVVHVTDFGLVHAAGGDRDGDAEAPTDAPADAGALDPLLTRTGALLGTPAYMAPEQHRGEPVDARTDQWSLACSLYGALYNQRPFAGETYGALSAMVLSGKLRPEPSDPAVPPKIRAAIRRALAQRPADRFASIDELIAALTPARRTWPVVVGAGGAVAAAAVIAIVATRGANEPSCAGVDAPLVAVWNPTRAQALRDHFAAANLSYGADAARQAIAGLDAYGTTWTAARTAACVQHNQAVASAAQIERRVSCLDQRVIELGALVAGLIDASPDTIRVAGDAVEALRPIGDCADARDTVPRPASAQARADIDAAEATLARASALADLAEFDQARPLAAAAVAVGERTGWAPLSARALLLLGRCRNRDDAADATEALASFDKAATAAAQARDDRVVAEALSSKFYELGEPLGKPGDAMAMKPYVDIALERAGNPWRVRALWLHNLAVILLRQDKYDDAFAAITEAVALWRANLPPGHYRLIDSLETFANVEIYRKQYDHALALYAEALAAATAAHGPNHPKVASIIMNQGVLEAQRGDLAAAVTYWDKAMAIEDAAGLSTWITRFNIGVAIHDLGRWQASIAPLTRALELADAAAPGDTLQVAYTADGLGPALASIGELDRAGAALARALRAGRAAAVPVVQDALAWTALIALARGDITAARAALAEAHGETGDPGSANALAEAELARATGDCKTAAAAYRRAIELATGEPSESNITAATFGLGACQITLGAATDAVTAVDARLAWLDRAAAEPGAKAEGQFVLAQALIASGGDAARAKSLAQAARTGFATLGDPGAKRAAVVDGWLRRH